VIATPPFDEGKFHEIVTFSSAPSRVVVGALGWLGTVAAVIENESE
jgi:hypothetical protein